MQKIVTVVCVLGGVALLAFLLFGSGGGGAPKREKPLGPFGTAKAFLEAATRKDTNAMLSYCDGAARQQMRQLMAEVDAEEKRLGVKAVKCLLLRAGNPEAFIGSLLSEDGSTLDVRRTIHTEEQDGGYKVVRIAPWP